MEAPQPLIESIYAGACTSFVSWKKQWVSKALVLEPAAGSRHELDGVALWGVDYPCISDISGFSYGCGYSVFDEASAVQS